MCKTWTEESHPVFIPPDLSLAEKLLFQALKNSLHGEIVLTMTNARSKYWIPKFRKLAKLIVWKMSNTTVPEFIKCLKQLIACKGKPSAIYSDNVKSFQAAAEWLNQIIKGEQLHEHLKKETINWKFNLLKAPWWWEHFERLIGWSNKHFTSHWEEQVYARTNYKKCC